jgi:Flp pilus assembly protein TadG
MSCIQLGKWCGSRPEQFPSAAPVPGLVNGFIRRKTIQKRASEKGAALVEFGIVAVLLFTVLFGVIEMERMLLVYTTLANSTRAAVRYAIVHGSDRNATDGAVNGPSSGGSYANVQSVVRNLANAGSLNTGDLTVTVSYAPSNAPGSTVSVKAVYAYDPFTALPIKVNLTSVSEGVVTF